MLALGADLASRPFIQSFAPSSGAPGTSVTISGANFVGVREVRFNNELALFTVVSPQMIIATVPLDAATGPLTVVTALGSMTTQTFFIVAPRISGFSPASGLAGARVTIEGANFDGAISVQFNGKEAANFSVVASTQIHATVPAGASSGPIRVVTAAGAASTTNNFVITGTEPVITGFSPTNGAPGTVVTIDGRNFAGVNAVKFNGTNAASFAVTAPSQISAVVPTNATTGRISVTTPSGTGISAASFFVTTVPVIADFSPTNGLPGTVVTIDGFNFSGATAVRFNGTNAANFSVLAATQIRATVPSGATTGPISIVTPRGTALSSKPFSITTAPLIADFSPAHGPPGTLVTINGINLGATTNVLFGTNTAAFTIVAPTQITATVPANARTAPIAVRSLHGASTSAVPFTVTSGAPLITSFSPAAGPPGISVLVEGLNFTGATAVQFNGSNATFSVTAATQINCIVPEGATSGFIRVITPFGTNTSATRFVVAPRITSFSPTNAPAGSSVIVRGTNFIEATAVRFNGALASFTVQSENQLTAIVPTNAVTGTISVANAGGIVASTNNFTVLPRITGFTPVIGGAGTRVAILGTHLGDATTVLFHGVPATFSVIGLGEIQATVPAGASTGPIMVVTRAGSAVSATPFQVSIEADLALTQADTPDPVLLGSTLTYTLTVTNRGPASAGAVTLVHSLSTNALFVSASVSQGGFTRTGQTIRCQFDTIAAGAAAQLRVIVSPASGEVVSSSATVSSTSPDSNSTNNTHVESTRVISPFARLAIQGLGPNSIALSWAAGATNQVLQTRATFSIGSNWTSVTNSPAVSGGVKTVILPAVGPSGFFRLTTP